MGADAQATYAVTVAGDSSGADNVADALVALKAKIQQGTESLKSMQAAMERLKQAGPVAEFQRLTKSIDSMKGRLGSGAGELRRLKAEYAQLAAVGGEELGGNLVAAQGKLADLAEKAGAAKAKGDVEGLKAIDAEIGQVRAQLEEMKVGLDPAAAERLDALAASIERASSRAGEGEVKLAEMQASLSKLDASAPVQQFKELEAALAAQKRAVAAAQGEYLQLGGDLEELGKKAEPTGVKGLLGSLEKLGGKVGEPAAKVKKLGEFLSTGKGKALAAAGAMVGLAAVAAMVAIGVAKAGFALAQFAFEAAEASKDRGDLAVSKQLAKAKKNAARLFKDINITPVLKGMELVLGMLDESTASGKALKLLAETIFNPLFGSASALAPLLKGLFQGAIIAALQLTIWVLETKKALDKATDGVAGKWLTVENAITAGKVAFAALAAVAAIGAISIAVAVGVILSPILLVAAAVYGLVLAWRALKAAAAAAAAWVVASFESLKAAAAEAVAWLVASFQSLQDAVAALTWEDIGRAIGAALGTAVRWVSDTGDAIVDALGAAFDWVVEGVMGIPAAFGAAFDAAGAAASSAFQSIVDGVMGIPGAFGAAFDAAVGSAKAAFDSLMSIDLTGIGKNIIQGLINGIASMAGAVGGAISSLASGITSGFTGALKIRSPSKVFAGYGRFTAEGFVEGVEAGSGDVDDAVTGMVSIPSEATTSKGAAPAARASAGPTININGPVYIGEREQPRTVAASLAEMVAELLEKHALGAGAPLGGTT